MKTNPVLNKGVTTYNTQQNNPSRVLSLSDKAMLKRSIYVDGAEREWTEWIRSEQREIKRLFPFSPSFSSSSHRHDPHKNENAAMAAMATTMPTVSL